MTFALAFALVAIIFGAMLWHFQRSLIYFPFGAVPAPLEVGLAGVSSVLMLSARAPLHTLLARVGALATHGARADDQTLLVIRAR